MKRRVLIFDDETQVRQNWKKHLESAKGFKESFQAEVADQKAFRDALACLESRQRGARSNAGQIDWAEESLLDEVAILFIDYDLLTLYDDKFEVGENVAYLARCFSRCGLIVALNQFGQNDFDLTLRGHPDSFADLNLGSRQIGSDALWNLSWRPDDPGGFRPWHWPHLPSALKAFESRCEFFFNNPDRLDASILGHLGFLGENAQILPRKTVEFIQGGEPAEETTFRDFVEKSGKALRAKDRGDERSYGRIAAARIAKWLERLVLAGQDNLVDAPHLVTRFPGLLDSQLISDIATWNAAVGLLDPQVHHELVAPFSFEESSWLSRAAWWGRGIGDSALRNRLDPWELNLPDFVFCEDISSFRESSEARAFVADVPSAFARRYVSRTPVSGVNYQPSVRFSQ